MSELRLFRDEALDARRARWHGDIVMSQPLSVRMVSYASVILALLLAALLYFGTYTRRVTVAGQLLPTAGVIKVYVPQAGIVAETHVSEGQRVRKGETLFVVSSDRQTHSGATQDSISEQARIQERFLQEQIENAQRLGEADRISMQGKLESLTEDLPQLDMQILNQKTRVSLAEQNYKRMSQLREQKFVSVDQQTAAESDFLDQKSHMDSLLRDRLTAVHNIKDARAQIATIAVKYDNQIADLKRDISLLDQKIVETELQREFVVTAPEAGIVGTITTRNGGWTDGNAPLASIVPESSKLQAELYAPSRAVGFLHKGESVFMRYQAFPYQKFGQSRGTINSIASVALSSAELTRTNVFETSAAPHGEPLYRVTVNLDSQTMRAYAAEQALRSGMLLEADIMSERRHLYEWVLEPLYSLGKKL